MKYTKPRKSIWEAILKEIPNEKVQETKANFIPTRKVTLPKRKVKTK